MWRMRIYTGLFLLFLMLSLCYLSHGESLQLLEEEEIIWMKKTELMNLMNYIEQQRKDIEILQKAIALYSGTPAKLKKLVMDYETKINNLEKIINDLKISLEERSENFEQQIGSLQNYNNETKKQLEDVKKQLTEWENEIGKWKDYCNKLLKEIRRKKIIAFLEGLGTGAAAGILVMILFGGK